MEINSGILRCVFIIFLFALTIVNNYAQEGIHIGFNGGPLKSLLENRNNNLDKGVKGRVSAGQNIYFHGGFNEHIGVRTGIEHAALGIKTYSSRMGVDYFYWTFSMNLRSSSLGQSKIGKRIFLNQNTGISYMNTGEKFSNGIGYIGNYLSDSSISHQRNWGLVASIGAEILVFKQSHITLDVICNIGTKDIAYYRLTIFSNPKVYVSKGSFISLQLGYKIPLTIFRKDKDK